MENIIEPSDKFDFSKLNLENPVPLQGGNFFSKLNFTEKQLPVLVQLPKCKSKHGLIKTQSTKKMYTDLLFNYFESDLLTWFENLETTCRELIFSKKDIWFQSEMDLDDIENMFISPTKPYKSGKFITIRAHIPSTKNIKKDYCLIYDENERSLETSAINDTVTFIPLINIEGIRFSSKSFQLDINLRQVMILSIENDIKKGCLIKRNSESLDKIENNKELEKQQEQQVKGVEVKEEQEEEQEEEQQEQQVKQQEQEKEEKVIKEQEKEEKVIKEQEKEEKVIKEQEKEEKEEVKENSSSLEESVDLKKIESEKSNIDGLLEVELSIDDIEDKVSLKKPNDVYMEIYKTAREKAKHMKQATIEAYLEARNIKTKYMLDEINPSDDESINSFEFEE
jgi:hypothetical protein